MSTPVLVGIDVGTQSAKVTVVDLDGGVLAEGRTPLRPTVSPGPGLVEHPDDDLWTALVTATSSAMSDLAHLPGDHEVLGVGLCGIRCCRALLRADGSLAAPVLSWMDSRASRPHEQVDDEVRWVTASSGYLTHRLTGRFRDSASAYQGEWPIDSERWTWDEDLLADYGVRADQLVELVLPGDELGRVTDAAAAATGLPVGVPVLATGNDKAVEALGCALLHPGETLVSLGTYIAAMTVGEHYLPARASYWTNFGAVPGTYLYESVGIRRGMWTVSWLRDLVGRTEDELEQAALTVPAGSEGLVAVLDWLAPLDQPWRRGALVGFDGRHGTGHLHRAILEGIALTMAENVRAMAADLGHAPSALVVSGGGAQSPLMLQVMADAFALPVVSATGTSPVSLGAAICAAVGTGTFSSVHEASARLVHRDVRVDPTPDGTRLYAELGALRRTLTDGLAPGLAATHALLGEPMRTQVPQKVR